MKDTKSLSTSLSIILSYPLWSSSGPFLLQQAGPRAFFFLFSSWSLSLIPSSETEALPLSLFCTATGCSHLYSTNSFKLRSKICTTKASIQENSLGSWGEPWDTEFHNYDTQQQEWTSTSQLLLCAQRTLTLMPRGLVDGFIFPASLLQYHTEQALFRKAPVFYFFISSSSSPLMLLLTVSLTWPECHIRPL